MAALATRAEIAAHHDFYLMPLPLTGETATQVESWITASVVGAQEATLLWDGERLLGAGYEFERPLRAMVAGESVCWTERVQVVRSPTLAERQQATLEKRMAAAEEELWGLTPTPGRGKRPIRDAATLQAAIARVLETARCRRVVDGDVGAARDDRDPLRGPWSGWPGASYPHAGPGPLCPH
jgi:hypothetical protein